MSAQIERPAFGNISDSIPLTIRNLDTEAKHYSFEEGALIQLYHRAKEARDQDLIDILETPAKFIQIGQRGSGETKSYLIFTKVLGQGRTHTVMLGVTRRGKKCAISQSNSINPDETVKETKYYRQLKNCPNVIQLKKHQDNFFVFPLAECSLYNLLQQKANVPNMPTLMLECLSGGVQIKERGILHLDLKLDNILIADGHIKIADFELSSFLDDRGYAIESLFGNLCNASPERIKHYLDHSTLVGAQDNTWGFMNILVEMGVKSDDPNFRLSPSFRERHNDYRFTNCAAIQRFYDQPSLRNHTIFNFLHSQGTNLFSGLQARTPLDYIVMGMAEINPDHRITIEEARNQLGAAIENPGQFLLDKQRDGPTCTENGAQENAQLIPIIALQPLNANFPEGYPPFPHSQPPNPDLAGCLEFDPFFVIISPVQPRVIITPTSPYIPISPPILKPLSPS